MTSTNNDSDVDSGMAESTAFENTTEVIIAKKPKPRKKRTKKLPVADDTIMVSAEAEKEEKPSKKTDEDVLAEKRQLIESKEGTFEDDCFSEIPHNFKLTKTTLYLEGTTNYTPVSSRIVVVALQNDLYSKQNYGMTLLCLDIRGETQKLSISRQLLSDERGLSALLFDVGLSIYNVSLLKNYLMKCTPVLHYSSVDRIGWHRDVNNKDVFVLPDRTIGHENAPEQIVYQSDKLNSLFKAKGTLHDWLENVGVFCTGNSRLMFAISHTFAAALLKPMGRTNGGVNLFGQSSTGKTTIARVCVSIVSNPEYLLTCRTTDNALEKTALAHNDCIMVLDEAAQMSSKNMGESVYMLGNGAGKERMKPDGELRPLITFRSNFMLTGEIPISQHIEEGGHRETEGQLIRVLDIPAVVGEHGVFDVLHGFKSGSELSKHLVAQSSKFYGTAYIEFLNALIKPEVIDAVQDKLIEIKRQLIAELQDEIGGQADRALDRFVLAAAAGELATELGITGWNIGDATKATVECFKAWLNQRGGVENQEGIKVLKQVKEFFELHGESRFTDITEGRSVDYSKTSNRAGFRAQVNEEWVYYVLSAGFQEMHQGFTQFLAIKSLIEAGWIQTNEITKNSKIIIESCIKQTIDGYGRPRVYIFNGLMWH